MFLRTAFTLGTALCLSVPAILQAGTAPAITTQPAAITVTTGKTASFSVTATGTATLTYQWRKNGVNVSGATARTYTTPITTSAFNGVKYQVYITNGYGAITSKSAILTVTSAPTLSITTQPKAQTVTAPTPATFSVVAAGSNLTYQWQKNGVNISGATASSYTTPATTSSDNGATFRVIVASGTQTLTSQAATLSVISAPILNITTQPKAQTVTAPAPATFSVVATGSNLTYQWQKNGVNIIGASASSYTTPATVSGDNGAIFQVVVGSGTQSLTSQSAALTVVSNTLGITTQPKSLTVAAPDGATFGVVASGNNLGYQWRKNGTAISGATTSSYTVAATDLHETSAMYSVVVSSGTNSVTSENATFTVMAPNPTYAGDPITLPNRPQTVLPSFTLNSAFPNGSFRLGYDEGLKNPLWTAYADFKFITAFPNGTRSFQPDTRLASPQVTDADYSSSGWTRGHQAMMSDLAYRYGAQAGTDTCRLSNIAPQSATHNNNFWNNLEQIVGGNNPTAWVPGLADTFKRIWVYTGPVFESNPSRFSTKNIAIPVAFYKIIVRETAPGVPKVLAILAPHAYTPANADLPKYVTSVARVEELTGLSLFPAPASPLPAGFLTTVEVRGWGVPFEESTRPNVHVIKPSWDGPLAKGTLQSFQGAATSATSTVVSSSWTFGDGSTATGLTTSHTYTTAGTYTVTFTVQDALGATNSLTRIITVN
ncbi:MAG: DNA/RNA non-specific endonuclease [Holophaga sp.]|nr:DNA/RNA non-specific endonuclease [Holophaga sp.]